MSIPEKPNTLLLQSIKSNLLTTIHQLQQAIQSTKRLQRQHQTLIKNMIDTRQRVFKDPYNHDVIQQLEICQSQILRNIKDTNLEQQKINYLTQHICGVHQIHQHRSASEVNEAMIVPLESFSP